MQKIMEIEKSRRIINILMDIITLRGFLITH